MGYLQLKRRDIWHRCDAGPGSPADDPDRPVPGAPHFVLGIVNLRGNVVTVVDTRVRFGLMSKEPDEYTRIIIVEAQDVVIGLLVDAVAEVVEVPSKSIETSPSSVVKIAPSTSKGCRHARTRC